MSDGLLVPNFATEGRRLTSSDWNPASLLLHFPTCIHPQRIRYLHVGGRGLVSQVRLVAIVGIEVG